MVSVHEGTVEEMKRRLTFLLIVSGATCACSREEDKRLTVYLA